MTDTLPPPAPKNEPTLAELEKQHELAKQAYHEHVQSMADADAKKASLRAEAARLMKARSDKIAEGAKPCALQKRDAKTGEPLFVLGPDGKPTTTPLLCGEKPHGMRQPLKGGRSEFEIRCLSCPPFMHTDGTTRQPAVRGGMIPRHAVEAWNEGPDNFLPEKKS